MIDVRRLAVLHQVAELGTFSAAARTLGYTQSAVSQQVAALEREVGARLVERLPRRVRLTDAGRVLVRRARTVLAELAAAEDELRAVTDGRAGRIRIAAFATAVSSPLLPAAVRRLRHDHPDVEVVLGLADLPADALRQVQVGDVDLALLVGRPGGLDRCRVQHLFDDPMLVALPAGHPLAAEEGLDLAALAGEEWVVNGTAGCPDAELVRQACRTAGFTPRIALELAVDDYQATLGVVAAGLGIGLLPRLALVPPRPDVVARPLQGAPIARAVVAVTRATAGALATEFLPGLIRQANAELAGTSNAPGRSPGHCGSG
jgi:DNA-binding transcriptional LysR family regulator